MTTYNGKSAIESTEQSLPDYRQDSTEEMRREFEKNFALPPYGWTFERYQDTQSWPGNYRNFSCECAWCAWRAAIASRQEELEGLRAAAKFWQEKAGRMSEELVKLQAKIEEADKQEPLIFVDVGHLREVSNGNNMPIYASCEQRLEPLFTRPPIQSERELELLDVIEQMRSALQDSHDFIYAEISQQHVRALVYEDTPAWLATREALAITPDMIALKEHDSNVFMNAPYPESCTSKPTGTPIDMSKIEIGRHYRIWEKDGRTYVKEDGCEMIDVTPKG